jgi:hypothetical protein
VELAKPLSCHSVISPCSKNHNLPNPSRPAPGTLLKIPILSLFTMLLTGPHLLWNAKYMALWAGCYQRPQRDKLLEQPDIIANEASSAA